MRIRVLGLFCLWAVMAQGQDLQVINLDTQWRYNQTGAELGTAWRSPGYDDNSSGWEGPGNILLGFETTPNNYAPLTFRTLLHDPAAQFITNFYFRPTSPYPICRAISWRSRVC
jgi:hypothetical protein